MTFNVTSLKSVNLKPFYYPPDGSDVDDNSLIAWEAAKKFCETHSVIPSKEKVAEYREHLEKRGFFERFNTFDDHKLNALLLQLVAAETLILARVEKLEDIDWDVYLGEGRDTFSTFGRLARGNFDNIFYVFKK